jgi:hypothetical protein
MFIKSLKFLDDFAGTRSGLKGRICRKISSPQISEFAGAMKI